MFKTGDFLLILFIIFIYPMLAWDFFKVSPLPKFDELSPITSELSYLEEVHVYRKNTGSYDWFKFFLNDYSAIFFANSGDELNRRAYIHVKSNLSLNQEVTIWAYRKPQSLIDVFKGDYDKNLSNTIVSKKSGRNSDGFASFNEPDRKIEVKGLAEYKVLQLAKNQNLLIDYPSMKIAHESNMRWNTRIWFALNIFIVGFILFKLVERSLGSDKKIRPE